MKIWHQISDRLRSHGSCALVTVLKTAGSTPRAVGARMLVLETGDIVGTIGGGRLEFEAVAKAITLLQIPSTKFDVQKMSLGPDLGQCCGGYTEVSIEVIGSEKQEEIEHLKRTEKTKVSFSTQSQISENGVLERKIIDVERALPIELVFDKKTGETLLFEQFGEPVKQLLLFGAGHIGRALILTLAVHPFEIRWIDSRKTQFPAAVPANVSKILSKDPSNEIKSAADGAFILAVSHSHALDEEIMACALLSDRFAYCGVVGSKTKRARFLSRLKKRGLSKEQLAKMICPIGSSALKSKRPEAIATSVCLELLIRYEETQGKTV